MAETATGRAYSSEVPLAEYLEWTRAAVMLITFRGLTRVDGRALVFMIAPTAPATYDAVTFDPFLVWQQPLAEWASSNLNVDPDGGLMLAMRMSFPRGTLNARTVGDHLWCCLFPTNPASGSDVPDVVLDLGEIN